MSLASEALLVLKIIMFLNVLALRLHATFPDATLEFWRYRPPFIDSCKSTTRTHPDVPHCSPAKSMRLLEAI